MKIFENTQGTMQSLMEQTAATHKQAEPARTNIRSAAWAAPGYRRLEQKRELTDLVGVIETMNMNRRWWISAAAILTVAGCAAEGPVKPAGLKQKIEAARTRVDHQDIAAVYEQQAEGDMAATERHRGLARAYERGLVWSGPQVGSVSSVKRENQSFIVRCENLARIYQQAAKENLALAREHRRLAAETKD